MISSLKTCTPIRKVPVFSDPRVTGYFVNKSNARWFCPLAVKISDITPMHQVIHVLQEATCL